MNFIKRMLKRARESECMSREQYNYESACLTSVKALIGVWADDYHRGEPLKGHDRVRWIKSCYARMQELDELFKEDEKLYKEIREAEK
jgi:hypothetical protein